MANPATMICFIVFVFPIGPKLADHTNTESRASSVWRQAAPVEAKMRVNFGNARKSETEHFLSAGAAALEVKIDRSNAEDLISGFAKTGGTKAGENGNRYPVVLAVES